MPTSLFSDIRNPDALKTSLEQIRNENNRFKAVSQIDKRSGGDPGERAFIQEVVRYPESFAMVLSLLQQSKKKLINTIFPNGERLIHSAAHNAASLRLVLDLYPSQDSTILTIRSRSHRTPLHHAAPSRESTQQLLALTPESDNRQNEINGAIAAEDDKGNTVIHESGAFPETCAVLLDCCPSNDRLRVVQRKNQKGESLIDIAAASARSNTLLLETILSRLPAKDRLPATQPILLYAALIPGLVPFIVRTISDTDRLKALLTANEYRGTVFNILLQEEKEPLLHSLFLLPLRDLIQALLSPCSENSIVWDRLPEDEQNLCITKLPFLKPLFEIKKTLSTCIERSKLIERLSPKPEDTCMNDLLQRFHLSANCFFDELRVPAFRTLILQLKEQYGQVAIIEEALSKTESSTPSPSM